MDTQMNLFADMIKALGKTRTCVFTKCKKQFDDTKKNNYAIEIEELEKKRKENKIDFLTFNNKKTELEIKIIEENYREQLLDCQLNKCYEETKHMISLSLGALLMDDNIGTPTYKIASKYKKIFEKNNYTITPAISNQLDVDLLRTKLKRIPKQKPKK